MQKAAYPRLIETILYSWYDYILDAGERGEIANEAVFKAGSGKRSFAISRAG